MIVVFVEEFLREHSFKTKEKGKQISVGFLQITWRNSWTLSECRDQSTITKMYTFNAKIKKFFYLNLFFKTSQTVFRNIHRIFAKNVTIVGKNFNFFEGLASKESIKFFTKFFHFTLKLVVQVRKNVFVSIQLKGIQLANKTTANDSFYMRLVTKHTNKPQWYAMKSTSEPIPSKSNLHYST